MSRRRGKRRSKRQFTSTHHIYPRSRRIKGTKNLTIELWWEKHTLWHALFGNMTIDEIIVFLQRVRRAAIHRGRA